MALNKQKCAGFTIVETMVASGILAIMLLSAIALIVKVNDLIVVNQRTITGSYLSQECQELVRNLRDTAWKHNLTWNCAFQTATGENVSSKYFYVHNTTLPAGNIIPNDSCYATYGGHPSAHHSHPPSVGTPHSDLHLPPTNLLHMHGPRPQVGYFDDNTNDDNFLVDDVVWDIDGVSTNMNYYRYVTFEYPAGGSCDINTGNDCDRVTANCRVWWYGNGGTVHEVEMAQQLTNWFKR